MKIVMVTLIYLRSNFYMKYKFISFLAIFNYCYPSENIIKSNAIVDNVDKVSLKGCMLSFGLCFVTSFLVSYSLGKAKANRALFAARLQRAQQEVMNETIDSEADRGVIIDGDDILIKALDEEYPRTFIGVVEKGAKTIHDLFIKDKKQDLPRERFLEGLEDDRLENREN